MSDLILVLNCGSSSIKFALFETSAPTPPAPATDTTTTLPAPAPPQLARKPLWNGKVDGITGPTPTFGETGVTPGPVALQAEQPYHAALEHIHRRVSARMAEGGHRMAAVAHRVVHGGKKYADPVRVDAHVLADLKTFIPLAPLHQPFALEAIEALLTTSPDLPQVACFDTAFHHTLPDVEKMLPLSWDAWERGLRRYGFHGLSYEFMSVALAERYGDAARGRTIVAHLGSGASLCGMQGLRSVATTMGFSALDGLMMGTRCGALDPGAVLYLMEIEKLSLQEVGHLLYHQSGLLGLSGVSPDPRVLLAQAQGNERIEAALALYVRRIVREIGALVAVLGGLDMLVFTAGIGEHNTVLRDRICEGLAYLGVALSPQANAQNALLISSPTSRVPVAVEPTNEEWIAAWHTAALMGKTPH
ncbi:MAG: acetate/propionate family kinase [Burkholderiaceae bacterium]|nr:acetate/propionate family kinase [Burkholderiaceae bacterium]